MVKVSLLITLSLLCALAPLAALEAQGDEQKPASDFRVYDSSGKAVTLDEVVSAMSRAEVVLIGDPALAPSETPGPATPGTATTSSDDPALDTATASPNDQPQMTNFEIHTSSRWLSPQGVTRTASGAGAGGRLAAPPAHTPTGAQV